MTGPWPVTTADAKYAELAEAHLHRPRCSCHGEPMSWRKGDGWHLAGGGWICRISDRLRSREWRAANPGRPRARSSHSPETDAVTRRRRIARNREIVSTEIAVRGAVCCDCARPYEAGKLFHWHHRRPVEKLFSIANGIGHRSVTAVRVELSKCDLICAHCHPVRQAQLRRQEAAS